MGKKLLLLFGLCLSTTTWGASHATVIVLRGNAKTQDGKLLKLKDSIPAGSTVTTETKSFIKLLFEDNTQMSIGPETVMKLEAAQQGEPNLVHLVGGQIRAKVTKDLLGGQETGKEKLIIKTKTAAMGIRGTDFNVSFNQQNQVTALITFEGSVAMTKLTGDSAADALSRNPLQMVGAGQFSGAQPDMGQATIPVKISPAQLESLRANDSLQSVSANTEKKEALASPVPPGVDPKSFASNSDAAIQSMAQGQDAPVTQSTDTNAPPPEGFYNAQTGEYAPRAGGFIDINTGRYIPPPPGSSFDPNTGVYVPPRAVGNFDPATGLYVPPKGVALDAVKGFVADAKSGDQSKTAQTQAVVAALNFTSKPENAGKGVVFDALFTPTGKDGFAPPPPPPTNNTSTSNTQDATIPQPEEPVDDPFCPTCTKDNIEQTPTKTTVNFTISVT